jgi:LuxR family maltose regulon positive regulatory protein
MPSDYIERKHLDPVFEQVESARILLVTAPSGYGKSLTLADWLERGRHSYAWFSLSSRYKELSLFIQEFVYAVRIHHPAFGEEALELSRAMEIPSPDIFGKLIAKELSTLETSLFLVLDDYHLVHNPAIDQLIEYLVTTNLPRFKLVLLTRQDPALPLSQWRMKHRLVEIRARDLMFRLEELDFFIQKNRNIQLNEERLKAIEKVTEGWISGLRLMLMSTSVEDLKNHSAHMESAGQTTSLYDLLNEFLQSQPEHIRLTLLKLSLLPEFDKEFFDTSLSTAKVESIKSFDFQYFVNYLKSSNIFLIALDKQDRWFRFHHLFRDLLEGMIPEYLSTGEQKELQLSFGNTCMQLSRYEQAIGHYLKAGQTGAAVSAFARIRSLIFSESSWQELQRIFAYFPEESIKKYSILGLTNAWLYVYKGNIPRMLSLLDPLQLMINSDSCEKQQQIHYMGELEVLHAYGRYNFNIDMNACLIHSKKALRMLGDSNSYATGLAWVFYGGSLQAMGASEKAKEAIYSELEVSKELQIQAHLYLILCYIYWLDGDLRDLRNTASHLIRFGLSHQNHEALANGYYFSGIANYYMNQGSKSHRALEEFYKLRPYTILVHQFFGTSALAFLHLTSSDEEKLDKLLLELETMAVEKGGPIYLDFSRAISSLLRWIRSKDPASLKWAREFNPRPLIPMTNFVALPVLQAYILACSTGASDHLKAVEILEDCVIFLKENHNTLFLVRTRIILTLAYANLKDYKKRNTNFEKAVSLAEPRSLGLSLRMLNAHMDDLLDSCHLTETQKAFLSKHVLNAGGSGQTLDPKELLSRRELEILQHVARLKTNKEIGNELYISEKTVKRHLANIYQKLQIKDRKEAIRLLSREKEEVPFAEFNR